MPRPRLVYVTTLAVTPALLLRGQLAFLREQGFDVHVVCSPGPELERVAEREGVTVHPLPIPREIDPAGDAIALARLTRLFRDLKPDIVNASTPKGGLLGMLAARACSVPVRIYLLRGLRLETTEGSLLKALESTERLAAAAAHQVVCVSDSLRDQFAPRFTPPEKCIVLGAGSSNGVSAARFARSPQREVATAALRERLSLPEGPYTIGFAGRMVEDKGITPLLDAFERVRAEVPDARLLLVGDDLAGDRVDPAIRNRVAGDDAIHVLPRMDELGPFYGLLDVLAFPSLREGFPNVPLEAAMAGLPVVGFASTGVVDAVQDGRTGRLVPTGDHASLALALLDYARSPEQARAHGEAGHRRAASDFAPERVWGHWATLYRHHLDRIGAPRAALPRRVLRRLNRLTPSRRPGAMVLAYHLVEAGTGGVVDLPQKDFEAQLDLLQRTREVVGLHAVEPDGDRRQVVLTFDDAYQNFYDVVWPLLRARGLPALLYVPVDFIEGGPCPIRGTSLGPCTWDQLREMVGEGLEIGSHTVHHRDVADLDPAQLELELVRSRALLEDQLGTPVQSFCYPRGLVHRRALPFVERTYSTATVGGGGRFSAGSSPHRIERISIRRDHDLATFARLLDADVWFEERLADRVRQLRR